MVNRLKRWFAEEPEESPPDADYFVVESQYAEYYVTSQTAERVLGELDRRRPPRWIRFRDIYGAEVRLRPEQITAVVESTAEQRERERAFRRARRQEEKEDRSWDDDLF